MKTPSSARWLAAALLLSSATFAACSKGTGTADINVERASNKDFGSATLLPDGDSLSTHAQPDTANDITGKELFDRSNDAADRNHDGIADSTVIK